MVEQGSGVILALNSGSANGSPMMGSTGPADAATDIFIRNLAAEVGPNGGWWASGRPGSRDALARVARRGRQQVRRRGGVSGLIENLDQMRMTRRSPRLSEAAATAAFLASDGAGAITGTFVNVTSEHSPASHDWSNWEHDSDLIFVKVD